MYTQRSNWGSYRSQQITYQRTHDFEESDWLQSPSPSQCTTLYTTLTMGIKHYNGKVFSVNPQISPSVWRETSSPIWKLIWFFSWVPTLSLWTVGAKLLNVKSGSSRSLHCLHRWHPLVPLPQSSKPHVLDGQAVAPTPRVKCSKFAPSYGKGGKFRILQNPFLPIAWFARLWGWSTFELMSYIPATPSFSPSPPQGNGFPDWTKLRLYIQKEKIEKHVNTFQTMILSII